MTSPSPILFFLCRFKGSLLFLFLIGLPLFAAEEATSLEDEYLKLEEIRFQHDILGERIRAIRELYYFIRKGNSKKVRAKAYFYLGSIYDQIHALDSASHYYRQALKESYLLKPETEWLYRRLAKINPELVEALTLKRGKITRVYKTFPYQKKDKTEFILQVNSKRKSLFNKRFVHINAKGNVKEFNLPLTEKERVNDIKNGEMLIHGKNYLKVISNKFPLEIELDSRQPLLKAHFLPTDQKGFILQYPQKIEYYREGQLKHILEFQGNECHWTPDQNKPLGTILCKTGRSYRINLETGEIKPWKTLSPKPYSIYVNHQKAMIQYQNHFEIRSTKNLDKVMWKGNSKLSDKISLNPSALYILDNKGVVKSLQLSTGQINWEHELNAKQLFAADEELYIISHAHACLGLSLDGTKNWTYEYGWDSQVTPLLGSGYLLLLYQNGNRIHINLDLIQISKSSNTNKIKKLLTTRDKMDWRTQLRYANNILQLEPGNGMAWNYKYLCLKMLKAPYQKQFYALTQAARSLYSPSWKNSPPLQLLNQAIGSNWIWKRSYGQKYYPNLIVGKNTILYLENNNQTLMLIDAQTGLLKRSIHIPEELDSKIIHWVNDKIIASSADKLYLIPTNDNTANTETRPLTTAICNSLIVGEFLYLSDWQGNLSKIDLNKGLKEGFQWKRNISKHGLLLSHIKGNSTIDVVDMQGKYFVLSKDNGQQTNKMILPEGTITDIFAQNNFLYVGYDDGQLYSVNKKTMKIAWHQSFSSQIFSLGGNNKHIVITTSSKKLFSLNRLTGKIISQININTSLINKPILTKDGYWLGTNQPALEKRDFNHRLLKRYPLTGIPGNPVLNPSSLFLSTLDGFIFSLER